MEQRSGAVMLGSFVAPALAAITLSLFSAPEADASTPADLESYLAANVCTPERLEECLEPITSKACSRACPRSGYRFNVDTADPLFDDRLDVHLTLKYLRKLRNTAVAHPGATVERFFPGIELEDVLYQQLQAMLRHPSTRYYDEDLNRLSLSDVIGSSHTVDPTLFYMVTWVGDGEIAHAMPQADLGTWLISVAKSWAIAGYPGRADYHLALSERVFRPLGVRAAERGVRNNKRSHRCHDNHYCYWFHSRPASTSGEPSTVLNQHLHAVRDALVSHQEIASWRDNGVIDEFGDTVPLPDVLSPDYIDNLLDWGRGGLFQLAYAAGSEVDASAPPNLAEFLRKIEIVSGQRRFRAYYQYNLGEGGDDISAGSNCHYHYHSLKVMKDILVLIEASPYFNARSDLAGVYFKLLYGRNAGDTRSCVNRRFIPKSRRVMNGVPLAELYQGGRIFGLDFQKACNTSAYDYEPFRFQCKLGDHDAVSTRIFFDQAYTGCLF